MSKVVKKLYNSIVFRMGTMMFSISFLAIVSMFSTAFISEMADKDALAINHSGSLRMQSYKILADYQQQFINSSSAQSLINELNTFEQKLDSPVLKQIMTTYNDSIIAKSLDNINQHWHTEIRPNFDLIIEQPELRSIYQPKIRQQINDFVIQIDQLVSLYQQHAEDRILLIRMIQGVSLFLTIILVVIIMFQLSRRVETPLSELTNSAKKIIDGDYTAHTKLTQQDELGFLANTMNQMADAISQSHLDLEKRVEQKTAELRQSNDSLELLFETSSLISQSSENLQLDPILTKLSKISKLDDLDLCLMTSEGSTPFEHLITTDKELSQRCIEMDCDNCITETVNCTSHPNKDGKISISYPLIKGEFNYGVLVCNLPAGATLEAWQHQLLSSITAQIATGLKLRHQSEQTRRLALTSERMVIARELHDSLAQALSYLKIQVTRLQKMRQISADKEQIDGVVTELKSGLNSAYRQLRELLTTFRLKIDSEGLQHAFEETITQLNNRSDGKINFSLDYQIGDLPLTPNEEIHIMQIAREATQNALHHSKGKNAKVSVFADDNNVINLIIKDDGVGLGPKPEKLNHYGLAIMKERAKQLGATLSIDSDQNSGTEVKINYLPKYASTA